MHDEFAGGTGDGKDNPKQVKTDKVLPAYCNPPNPCPIGYTCKLKKKTYLRLPRKENICHCICFNGYRGNVFFIHL